MRNIHTLGRGSHPIGDDYHVLPPGIPALAFLSQDIHITYDLGKCDNVGSSGHSYDITYAPATGGAAYWTGPNKDAWSRQAAAFQNYNSTYGALGANFTINDSSSIHTIFLVAQMSTDTVNATYIAGATSGTTGITKNVVGGSTLAFSGSTGTLTGYWPGDTDWHCFTFYSQAGYPIYVDSSALTMAGGFGGSFSLRYIGRRASSMCLGWLAIAEILIYPGIVARSYVSTYMLSKFGITV
jgi:hypothetical protein